MNLKGKVALITGGGTGIGAAVAERFVSDGARVCIAGRRAELLDRVAKSLPAGTVVTCPGDVSRDEDARQMVDAAVEFGGRLDVLVNNAGMDPRGSITKVDAEVWRRVIEVNLTDPFLLMKASIPHMIKAGGGSIINIASLAGTRCLPAAPAYCSSKAGLIMLTRQAALDYGIHNIRSNVICPGGVKTEMVDRSFGSLAKVLNTDAEGAIRIAASGTPLRRVAVPREVSGVCAFLAGDDSTFMTGAVLMVDGGTSVVCVSGAMLSNAGVNFQ